VGPLALFDVKGANFAGAAVHSQDLEVGDYGRAYITASTNEPGLEADGLAIVEGFVDPLADAEWETGDFAET
jgi:hypothetical protein